MVSVYLYAVIVELSIKAVWLFEDQGRKLGTDHNVARFFSELRPETKTRIREIYGTYLPKCQGTETSCQDLLLSVTSLISIWS